MRTDFSCPEQVFSGHKKWKKLGRKGITAQTLWNRDAEIVSILITLQNDI